MPARNSTMSPFLKEHLSLYVFVFVLFVTGVAFGAVMVGALTLEQKQELARFLNSFFHLIDQGTGFDQAHSFQQSVSMHMKWVAMIWLLGLSVIGLPVIFALDFLKGVLVGFSIGYLVGEFSWKGLLFSLVSVVPQNLVIVPAVIVLSASASAFSMYLIKNRFVIKQGSIYSPFMRYCFTTISMALLLAGISLYEAFLSPSLMRWVTPMLLAL